MIPRDWKGILATVTTPLTFFGLFVLVLGVVAIIAIWHLEPAKIYTVLLGIGVLALIVLCVVSYLILFRIEDLIFSAFQRLLQGMIQSGTKESPTSRENAIETKRQTKVIKRN